jgi:hypothetical protein
VTLAGYAIVSAGTMADVLAPDPARSVDLRTAVQRHRNSCSASAPPGTVQVTNCVKKAVKRRNLHVQVKLRLNHLGQKLLNEQGGTSLQVAADIAEHQGGSSPLAALLRFTARSCQWPFAADQKVDWRGGPGRNSQRADRGESTTPPGV